MFNLKPFYHADFLQHRGEERPTCLRALTGCPRGRRCSWCARRDVSRTQPIVRHHPHVRDEGQERMVRRAAVPLVIIPLGRILLVPLTGHHRGVEVQSVIVKLQLGDEAAEQPVGHTLIDGLGEFVEISLVSPVVRPTF